MGEKQEIIEFSKGIGIDLIGFCDIDFSNDLIEILRKRREEGHLSGFEEENENKRVDVSSILPSAKTIISIAVPYKIVEVNKDKPYISKASLGVDYHNVVKDKLNKISDFIKGRYNAKCVELCDISPLCEREIAVKCGLGFIGYNCSLITEKYGSYVFIGEIVTDLYIERSEKLENKCMGCLKCIKNCPSCAIVEPYHLNAKKCLSFITQKKVQLTDEEMDKLGNRIYGCDTCQDVCPHNIDKSLSEINEFIPEDWNININVEDILKMNNKDFKRTFKGTALGWRGKNTLKRNTIIALGNSKDKSYIETLKRNRVNSGETNEIYIERSIKKLEEGYYEKE